MAFNSLHQLNTFALPAQSNELIVVESLAQLIELLPVTSASLVLGGGSNMLFCQPYQGRVLLNKLRGIEYWQDNEHHYFKVAGGENWHDLVMHSVAQGIGGLENLALIPGSVGAAPVQNIGAYGVELANVCHQVVAYDLDTGECIEFDHEQCQFAYRESLFKVQRRYFISEVTFKLTKRWQPVLDYGELKLWAATLIDIPTPQAVAQQVIKVRNSKLPNPDVLPNVGSFFKNPIVSTERAAQLKIQFPDMPQYCAGVGVKLAAGWLIDNLGLKGTQVGGAAVHEHQALVLVNRGMASSTDVIKLARLIIDNVQQVYHVALEPEVNIIGKTGYSSLSEVADV